MSTSYLETQTHAITSRTAGAAPNESEHTQRDIRPNHILLVEDDRDLADVLRDLFEDAGYRVSHTVNGSRAKSLVETDPPHLIVLDLKLPDVDGLLLCADLRVKVDAPIIICSGTDERRDALLGFKLGADDFVPKPFDIEELLARAEASLRRVAAREPELTDAASSGSTAVPGTRWVDEDSGLGVRGRSVHDSQTQRAGTLAINHGRRLVTVGGEPVAVTPTEYRILTVLSRRPTEVITRDELAMEVWGYQDPGIGRSLDVHMRRLRLKLGAAAVRPPAIVAVRGFGYKLMPEVDGADS